MPRHRILLSLVVCALLGVAAITLALRGNGKSGVRAPSPTLLAPSIPEAALEHEPQPRRADPARETVASEAGARITPVAAPAARLEDESFVISGRVVDDLGEPLPRCRVTAERAAISSQSAARGQPPQGTFTNQVGRFALAVSGPGQWAVTAQVPGRRSAPGVATLPNPEAELVLVVARSASIRGSVIGEGGVPLAGARVHLVYTAEDYPYPDDFSSARSGTRADPSGGFELRDVLPGRIRILARHEGYAESEMVSLSVRPNEVLEDVVIALSRGGRIEGELDPALGDLGDREIGLYSRRGLIGWRSTRTDAQGRFYIENVMPQEYTIELKSPSSNRQGRRIIPGDRKRILVVEGATTQVEFGPEAPASIFVHGRVLSSGTPVSGLEVVAYTPAGTAASGMAATDSEGSFTLSVEKPGDHQFHVRRGPGSTAIFDRTLPDQPAVELLLEVPGGALSGRVLGPAGEVVGRMNVTLVRSGGEGDLTSYYRDYRRRTYTDAGGSFEFQLLEPGSYTLRAPDGHQLDRPLEQSRYGRAVIPDIVIYSAPVEDFDVRLQRGGRVSGVLVDNQGHAVTNAWIHALDSRGISLSSDREVQTDATGHFVVAEIAQGIYTLVAKTAGLEIRSAPVIVEAGKTVSVRIVIP